LGAEVGTRHAKGFEQWSSRRVLASRRGERDSFFWLCQIQQLAQNLAFTTNTLANLHGYNKVAELANLLFPSRKFRLN
jgi:hypothetical protein